MAQKKSLLSVNIKKDADAIMLGGLVGLLLPAVPVVGDYVSNLQSTIKNLVKKVIK